ncbi:alpha-amylase 3, chloroplastic isoform X1 [Glycine soja]|uniref:alpha-amylase n=2 Tax=Glycine soja TaxID=3848 RepID=A0A445JM31_GLYSO|nr:alpha-amylase 3, chloroplastic isoform X1 [Glycine soja]RZB99474.1 Alpha-amylase 3, chloroplastic isoform A [Glycine soja]
MSISTTTTTPLFCFNHYFTRERELSIHRSRPKPFSLTSASTLTLFNSNNNNNCNYSFASCKPHKFHTPKFEAFATNTDTLESIQSSDVSFDQTFPINRTELVEGKIFVRLDQGKDLGNWELTVGCNLPGKWILHWGVSRVDDVGSEWDQPPRDMIPPGSIPIKDYAIETPMKKSLSSAEGDILHEVKIDLKPNNDISAINFVLKDEETGAWYQHKGRDFKVPLVNYLKEDANIIGPKKGFSLWPGALGQISNILLKSEATHDKDQDDNSGSINTKVENSQLEGFYVDLSITKEVIVENSISVSIRKCSETAKNILYLETDIPGDILLHWGVCRDDLKWWEIPPAPHPPETIAFKDRALRTKLQSRDSGEGSSVQLSLGEEFSGFLFVLKLNDSTWINDMGDDFYIPLPSSGSIITGNREDQSEGVQREVTEEAGQEESISAFTDEIINEIRHLVTDISSEKNRKTKSKEAQESILQEIEKLAAEAYSIFRSSVPSFSEETIAESEAAVESKTLLLPDLPPQISSGTGTGYEIVCQGFNWESHKSGRWYMELKEKAAELASFGFTVIWLPPPTESVSPEGYMPKDLYNLNSRYGTIDELKDVVKTLHEVGIKVLGDAVLNHRCAHFKNQSGIWNLFGGRLNWDDRAIVADDPHFQGRGNKSSGDNFHAAPNIDHSQDFVRKDLKEWLCWMREEIGYDGWRLDFVRGFWGGYVKDYLEASEPYFAVGEYWDSLSYTYGEMDHNQDAHRQRIVDWINATAGTAGAFDVTTKGILHSALERCEYWRLSDQKGKPPGVLGWWPSRAVTFIENHDTGSTQGHWRFPSGKEMQGYAYTLTHPGTPSVFYDHIFSHYKTEIATLISIRKRNKIHCRSTLKICKAERDVYAAIVDDKVAMKIGPGHFEPPSGSQRWSSALEGRDYKIWEAS